MSVGRVVEIESHGNSSTAPMATTPAASSSSNACSALSTPTPTSSPTPAPPPPPAAAPAAPHRPPSPPPSTPPLQLPSTPAPSFQRLLSLNAHERNHSAAGGLSAAAFGVVQPVYALTIGGMIAAFFAPIYDEMRARLRTYSFIFSGLATASIVL